MSEAIRSVIALALLLWYQKSTQEEQKGMMMGFSEARRSAFGSGTAGNTRIEQWNRIAASYMRFTYSDVLWGWTAARLRFGSALCSMIAGYALIASVIINLAHGESSSPATRWLFLVFFLTSGVDFAILYWLSRQRKAALLGPSRQLLQPYRVEIVLADLAKESITEVPGLPWWWMDQSADRLRRGMWVIFRFGGVLLVSASAILGTFRIHFPLSTVLDWIVPVLAALLLWTGPFLAYFRMAPWCGYGSRRPSFAFSVFLADLRELE